MQRCNGRAQQGARTRAVAHEARSVRMSAERSLRAGLVLDKECVVYKQLRRLDAEHRRQPWHQPRLEEGAHPRIDEREAIQLLIGGRVVPVPASGPHKVPPRHQREERGAKPLPQQRHHTHQPHPVGARVLRGSGQARGEQADAHGAAVRGDAPCRSPQASPGGGTDEPLQLSGRVEVGEERERRQRCHAGGAPLPEQQREGE